MLLNAIDKIPFATVVSQEKRTLSHNVRAMPYQITAQPSGSWKLNAISVPLGSVHTINVSSHVARVLVSSLFKFAMRRATGEWNLAVSGTRHLWRFLSPKVTGRVHLQIRQIFAVHPAGR